MTTKKPHGTITVTIDWDPTPYGINPEWQSDETLKALMWMYTKTNNRIDYVRMETELNNRRENRQRLTQLKIDKAIGELLSTDKEIASLWHTATEEIRESLTNKFINKLGRDGKLFSKEDYHD